MSGILNWPIQELAVVQWTDAAGFPGWVSSDEEIDEHMGGSPTVSVGWVLRDDKRGILLADTQNKGQVGGTQFIPRGMVKSVKRLKW